MPIYVTLYKFTDQGIKAVKESPARVDAVVKGIEGMGGKVLGVYYTMGEYDMIAIAETPNDEAAWTTALMVGRAGNVRSTTMKAYTKDQFAEIVKKLP